MITSDITLSIFFVFLLLFMSNEYVSFACNNDLFRSENTVPSESMAYDPSIRCMS